MPDATLQWGSLYSPTVSKIGFNTFNAAFSFFTNDPLQAMPALLRVA